jgi:hypothetical protein
MRTDLTNFDMPVVTAISAQVKNALLIKILFAVLQTDLEGLDKISVASFLKGSAVEMAAADCNAELDRLGWNFFRVEAEAWSSGGYYNLALRGHHKGDDDEPTVLHIASANGICATYGNSRIGAAGGVKNLRWVILRQVGERAAQM